MVELHPSEISKKILFKDFFPFIHMEGTEEKTKKRFISFLSDLFDVSLTVWAPGVCHACEYLEGKANEVVKESYQDVHVEPKSYYGDAHFWLTVKMGGYEKELIVDPFGVYTLGEDHYQKKRTIVPFFGTIENAKGASQKVYSEGKPLGSRGYHIFHP